MRSTPCTHLCFSRQALQEPLTITHHGIASLVLLSHSEYERLKSRDREVLTLSDFTDEDRDAIAAPRAPSSRAGTLTASRANSSPSWPI
jgi:PHD/YefM family antitoxin component YafN of YafNO toxin-antitoxin module